MTNLSHSVKYTCINSDEVYYSDLKISLRNSVKFDLFNNAGQIATLITNNKKTFSLTTEGNRFSLQYKSTWINKWWYKIIEDSGKLIATIFVHQPLLFGFLKESLYSITFEETNHTYILTELRKRQRKYSSSHFQYDLVLNNEVKCSIINLKKPKGFFVSVNVEQEGIIEFDDSIHLKEILCFLQMLHINIDLETPG